MSKAPKVFFSAHGLGQQGTKAAVKGMRIGGYGFIVSLYTSVESYTAVCYHTDSCTIFKASVSSSDVVSWVQSTFQSSTFIENGYVDLDLLKPSRSKQLHHWLIDNLVLDLRKESFKIVFRCHLDRNHKDAAVSLIQRVWRGHLGRRLCISMIQESYLKVRADSSGEQFYYLNRHTGASSWEKPTILRNYDLPIEDKWMEFRYEVNGEMKVQYVNPFRGVYTNTSLDRAAYLIQAAYRNHMIHSFYLTPAELKRVIAVVQLAKTAYNKDSTKLMNVINFALVVHIIEGDERLARVLYHQALEISDSSPLVIRAFAVFLMGVCEAPIKANQTKAQKYFKDANRRDISRHKFELAYLIIKFAVYMRPRQSQTLLNLALVEHFVYENRVNAETLLRRALILEPFNERMVELWSYFKDMYAERKNMHYAPSAFEKANTSKGCKRSVVGGRTVLEDPSWAGWCYVERDEHSLSRSSDAYWYHPTSGESSWEAPDFQAEWKKRLRRSKFEGAKHGLEYYFDPYTSTHFQYHPLSDTYH